MLIDAKHAQAASDGLMTAKQAVARSRAESSNHVLSIGRSACFAGEENLLAFVFVFNAE